MIVVVDGLVMLDIGTLLILYCPYLQDGPKKLNKILYIDQNILKNKDKKFKEVGKIIPHGEKMLEGPEDPRLFYYKNDIYILVNELTKDKKRHMFVSKIDVENLTYDTNKKDLCKSLSTNFEKNWGSFMYKNKLHMLYDIIKLKILEVDDNFKCKWYSIKENY